MIYLNETASLIWRLCNGQHSIADITTLLQDAYPHIVDDIEADVRTTLQQFEDCGAIELR